MLILGIESSCDETAAAVVNGRLDVLASVVSSQIDLHRVTHGVVPEVAARAHTEKILPVIHTCLRKAQVEPRELDAIAVTRGPGLITSLLVGLETAKALSFALGVPLIGVNHIEGHVLSNLLMRPKKSQSGLRFEKKRLPLVVLTVSGGHTELILLQELGRYKLLGRTRDDAAGEAFDKVARLLDLPYPGGPAIGKQAEQGDATRFVFPRPMLSAPNFDFSFAGLKTAVAREVERLPKKARSGRTWQQLVPDIAASFEQAVVDTLLGKAFRALQNYQAKELWIVGGVAANQRLRTQAAARAKKGLDGRTVRLEIPSFEFCTDNAVMIAAVGALKYKQNRFDRIINLQADPNLDLVVVRG
ncbi:MAG: tRNA (adenosine(37)-N6)-threonylcarbamoyltransferase complex transferase subunit TsaD [Candidatus Andersenbacteria bacterium]